MPAEYRIYKSQGIVGMSGSSTLVHTTAILSDWRRWPCPVFASKCNLRLSFSLTFVVYSLQRLPVWRHMNIGTFGSRLAEFLLHSLYSADALSRQLCHIPNGIALLQKRNNFLVLFFCHITTYLYPIRVG